MLHFSFGRRERRQAVTNTTHIYTYIPHHTTHTHTTHTPHHNTYTHHIHTPHHTYTTPHTHTTHTHTTPHAHIQLIARFPTSFQGLGSVITILISSVSFLFVFQLLIFTAGSYLLPLSFFLRVERYVLTPTLVSHWSRGKSREG